MKDNEALLKLLKEMGIEGRTIGDHSIEVGLGGKAWVLKIKGVY